MPIRFNRGGGGPYIRFSPAVNAWTTNNGDEFDPRTGLMAIDVENVQMGWLLISEGHRDWQPWPSLDSPTDKPDEDYRLGFRVSVHAPKLLGDEVHDWSSNQVGCTSFMEQLYNSAEETGQFGKGLVPLVQITGTSVMKIGKGTTRSIEYEIKKWVPRPAAMAAVDSKPTPAPAARPVERTTPPSTGSTRAAPPPARPAPAAVHEEEMEY